MVKFIKYTITIFVISVFMFELIIFGITTQKKGVFQPSYQSLILDKYRMLQKTDEKKIIMVSGSSSSFGLDQNMLEKETGYKVVNLGLDAGFGHLFYSELAKENINPGDIVLLGYEYGWEISFDTLGQDLIMTGIDDNIDMYKHIPIKHWPDFIGYMFKYAEKKNSYSGASGINSREAFDDYNGQMTWLRDYAMSDYQDNINSYGTISVSDGEGNVILSDTSIEYLKSLKEYVEGCGAEIYFVSSPILYDSVTCDSEDFLKLVELEEEKIGIPYISDPRLYMFPIDLMSNSVNHCNSEGEKIRTHILIDDLRYCGAVELNDYSNITKENKGESFALVDTLPKKFLHKPSSVFQVYRVNTNGELQLFQEGIDYIIDYERGTIRRTLESSIPNYSFHSVSYSNGKFAPMNTSENYNPESNRSYQIMVDYDYYVTENELKPISNQSNYLSENLRNKIENDNHINIALCGDSIGVGADTNGNDIFLNYIDKALTSYYDIEVNTRQLSVGGRNRDLLLENIDNIIDEHPDLLMIEFGMNDHYGTKALSKEQISSYRNDIESIVKTLKDNEIDVILIGFFQQNMTLEGENIEATILYNETLKDIAQRNNIYFADVYSAFEKLGNQKHLSRDVMADFIHHPTEWGHKLYFTSLLSAFNIDGNMKPIDFENYIYLD